MVEKVRNSFEGLSLSMRFVLPAMFALAWYCYQGDMHSIKDGIADIKQTQAQNVADVKNSQLQIWKTLNDLKDNTNSQFIQIYQRIH